MVVRDDGLAAQPDASAELIVLNPPFHIGSAVHTGIAHRMFADAVPRAGAGRRVLDRLELAPRLPCGTGARRRPDPPDRPQREIHRDRLPSPARPGPAA